MSYRIYNHKRFFTIDYKGKRVGPICYTVEEAKDFIEEHKKMIEFNIQQIRKENE